MRYAIFLTFDPETESALQSLREQLTQNVPGVPKVTGKMGPHLTLAVFDDNDQQSVIDRFQTLTPQLCAFEITLYGIASFPGRRKVIFADPMPSSALKEAFELCQFVFSKSSAMVPAYQNAEAWHPHVTLTKGIGGHTFHEAFALANTNWQPLAATAQTLGLIDVQNPLKILASKKMKLAETEGFEPSIRL